MRPPLDEKTGEVFLETTESIGNYLDLLKSHIEMMEAARARIFTVLGYHFENEVV